MMDATRGFLMLSPDLKLEVHIKIMSTWSVHVQFEITYNSLALILVETVKLVLLVFNLDSDGRHILVISIQWVGGTNSKHLLSVVLPHVGKRILGDVNASFKAVIASSYSVSLMPVLGRGSVSVEKI